MDEASLGTGICKFLKGDYVAIASKAACSNIHVNTPIGSHLDKSTILGKVGTVESVTPTDDVKVTFGRALLCTVASKDLIKIEHLRPGDLVKLVDDIRGDGNLTLEDVDHYKSAVKDCGHICLVLENCVDKNGVVYVTVGADHHNFRPLHLDFVARPLYGDFMARVREYACKQNISEVLAENLFAALEDSMQDLPVIGMFPSLKSSPYAPGKLVKLSDDVIQFIQWQMKDSSRETRNPSASKFERLQDYARSGLHDQAKSPFPTEQVVSLLQPGRVVQANSDGDVIVEFRDGRTWCIRSGFLQLVESAEASQDGTRTCSPRKLSEGIDNFIRYAHNQGTKDKKALLHAACFSGNKGLIDLMLAGNLGLDCEDENGNKPLHYAAHGNKPEIIRFLLSEGANINATNKHKHTALHFAVKEGFLDCVRELTKYHVILNANIKDDMGNTALHVAIAGMNAEMVNELANLPKVDFSVPNNYGLNTLHMAALKGNVGAAKMILSRREDLVNLQQGDQEYASLHFAAVSGHHTFVETLLKTKSCAVDRLTKYRETALLLAAREGHWDIVQTLRKFGADINRRDRHGNTALHLSLMKVNEQPVKPVVMPSSSAIKEVKEILGNDGANVDDKLLLPCFLVRCGADFNLCNKKGRTPLDIASDLDGRLVALFWHIHVRMGDSLTAKQACGGGPSPPSNLTTEKNEVIQSGQPIREEGVYRMENKPRGMCLIINNINFKDPSERRTGSQVDAERMERLFTDFHFDVTVKTDLSAGDMLLALSRAARAEQQKNADCLVVILMSHGANDVICGVDGEVLNLRHEVYPLFNNALCPALKHKPKLFFVQACRGENRNCATDSSAADSGTPYALPEWSDMYCAYATILDYVAFRDTENGSWFISAIYNVFRQHAATTDLEGLMLKVTDEVMQHTTSKGEMQTTNPNLVGWRKKLYFNPGH